MRPTCVEDDYEGTHCYHWHHREMPCCDCGNDEDGYEINYECVWSLTS